MKPTFSTNASEFFPCLVEEEKILAIKDSYNLYFINDPNRAFRSSPPSTLEDYLDWFEKFEKVKGDFWKTIGIFDLIQLSKLKLTYHPAMMINSFFF